MTFNNFDRVGLYHYAKTAFGWKSTTMLEAKADLENQQIVIRRVVPCCCLCGGGTALTHLSGENYICANCAGVVADILSRKK